MNETVKPEKEKRRTRGSASASERKALKRLNKLTMEQEKMSQRISLDLRGWLHPKPTLDDDEFFGKLKKFKAHVRKIQKCELKIEEHREKQVIK